MSNNHGFIKKNNIFYVYKCFVTSVEKTLSTNISQGKSFYSKLKDKVLDCLCFKL